MKKLLICTVVLLAAVLLLTTGALAYDPLYPPQPGAADGWYETENTFYMGMDGASWSEMDATATAYEFNEDGLPVKSTVVSTGSGESGDYLYEYDSQGRLTRSVRTDGNHEMRYDYRDDGSHLQIYTWWSSDETAADARTSYQTYDPQVGWYWYGSFRFELDDKGMISRRWNEDVEYVYTTAYDAQGRVSKVTVENTQDHTVYTDEYTYSDDGYTMREGTRTGYEEFIYDSDGRLTKYIFGYEDNVPPYEYFYDEAGNCVEVRGSQRRWTYAYAQPPAKEQPAFTDVTNPEAFYYTPVYWAVSNGITNGTSPTTFGPDATCTRGQVVTFLWRAAGSPEPSSTGNPFTDLKPGAFYEKAVAWAVENNITSGTSPTTFSPDKGCTRGQVVAFLWRAAGSPEPTSAENPFTDLKPGAFYEKAVAWAVENKVTSGTSRTAFSPDATCTRGQIVTFLYRAQNISEKPVEAGGLVGICMPTADLWRWRNDGVNLEKRLQDAGYEVELCFASNDPVIQLSQIESLIAEGAKVLVIAAVNGDALIDSLENAKNHGVKVIAYDRLIRNSDAVNYYVTFDKWQVGVAQGEYIESALDLKNAGGKTYNIELVTGDPGDNSINFFYDGAMSVLQKYLDSGVLVCRSGQTAKTDAATQQWSSDIARIRFYNILAQYYADQPLHAVLASNDSTAQGVAAALADSYKNDVYPIITGQDCDIANVKNMLDDKQAMSVFKNSLDLVGKAAEMVDAIMKGSEPPVNDTETFDNGADVIPSFLCEPKVCTKDNIQELLIDTGYYTWEDLSR